VMLFSSAVAVSSVQVQDSNFSGCSATCGLSTFVPALGGAIFLLGSSSLSMSNVAICGGGIGGNPATLSSSSGGGAVATAAVPSLSFDTLAFCGSTIDASGNAQFLHINASGIPQLQLTITRSNFSGFISAAINMVLARRVNFILQEVTFYAPDTGIKFIQSLPSPSVTFSGRNAVLYCPAGAFVSIFNSSSKGFAIACGVCTLNTVALTNSSINLEVLQSQVTQVLPSFIFPLGISHMLHAAIHVSRPRFTSPVPSSCCVRFWIRQLQHNNQRFIRVLGRCCIQPDFQAYVGVSLSMPARILRQRRRSHIASITACV